MGRGVLIVSLLAAAARAETSDPTPELNAERDALIDKIARGVEYDASVKRFRELVQKRDAVVATSHAAQEKARADRDARHAWREAYHQTADYEVSWRCTLSADPANPVPSDEGRFRGDWGRVQKKERVRLAPKNELDEGEPATLYRIAGARRSYLVHGERSGLFRKPFQAEVGDLVLVCDGGSGRDRKLPAPFADEPVQTGGFAVRIAAPPRIADKARWNPIHITGSRFFWAVHDVKWKYPPDAFVLANLELGEDLGGGRWKIDASQGLDWVLEVGPSVKRRELLVPGHAVWAILGHARFDKSLRKLVLVAEDLEDRYVSEK